MGIGITRTQAASYSDTPLRHCGAAIQTVVSFVLGGKRIRGRTVLAGKTLCGGSRQSTACVRPLPCRKRIGTWARCAHAPGCAAIAEDGKLGSGMGNHPNDPARSFD